MNSIKIPQFEKLCFVAFVAVLVTLALYNLHQEKNADDFLTKQVGETMEDTKDSRPIIDELRDRMPQEDVKVDITATPIQITLEEVQGMILDTIVTLVDITNGEEIRGVKTEGLATGIARAGMVEGNYYTYAIIDGLSIPNEGDYYEVWATRRIPFSYVSLGQLESKDEKFQLVYGSSRDFIYDFLYITLESGDGNPNPADFILQGEFDKVQ